jgi:hypothetical protein
MLMNMENENVNQISYEALRQAYDQLLQQAQELEKRYQLMLQDRSLEKIRTIGHIIESKDAYSDKIVKLAEWHLTKMLEKPKA